MYVLARYLEHLSLGGWGFGTGTGLWIPGVFLVLIELCGDMIGTCVTLVRKFVLHLDTMPRKYCSSYGYLD